MSVQPLLNYRYKILKALAEGGFGKTFLAEDTQMPSKRRCVIKQLKPVSSRPDITKIVQERFTREAAVLDTVGKNHGQIPTLYAYFVTKGQFYLVQEWIDGEPLQVAAHKRLPEESVHQLLKDILPAIAHVHSKNVIHRDIKPDNIIVRKADQQPCLIDFGAVKELMSTVVGSAGLPKSSIVIGTAGYMPQEQAAGRPTFSSDLYSLGMTAICVLIGKHPAAIPTDSKTGQLLWQQYIPSISPAFASVLTKAIHSYPQHRYHSAAEMLAALTNHVAPAAGNNFTVAPPTTTGTVTPPGALSGMFIPAIQEPTIYPATGSTTEVSIPGVSQGIDQRARQSNSVQSSTSAFPVKGAAATVAAFALGAGLLIAVRPQPGVDTASSDRTLPQTATTTVSNANLSTAEESLAEPTSAEGFTDRATSFYSQGRLAQALQDVDAAIELDPNALAALSLKGDILANQSRIDLPGAIAAYTQALTLEPNNTDLLQKRCTTYQNNSELALAEQDCTRLIGLLPESATLLDQRGDIYLAQENYQSAIEDYTRAIELNEKAGNPAVNQSIYYSRGNAYAGNGEPGKGLEDFEKMRTAQ